MGQDQKQKLPEAYNKYLTRILRSIFSYKVQHWVSQDKSDPGIKFIKTRQIGGNHAHCQGQIL